MSIDLSDEILQDFLIEAGEILESLGEQLIELEQSPGDYELLNAIFRGFHTIKGGAGFLNLTAMVGVCHHAEDVFNVLRQGERSVTPSLMDVILKVVDVVNNMFEEVRSGQEPEPASPVLIDQLKPFAVPESAGEAPPPEELFEAEAEDELTAQPEAEHNKNSQADTVAADEITEEEFDALLDALQAEKKSAEATQEPLPVSTAVVASDEITEEEFEALLDQLHGNGQVKAVAGGGAKKSSYSVVVNKPGNVELDSMAVPKETARQGIASDEITDDEFEALLDDLHGKGKHTDAPLSSAIVSTNSAQTPVEESKPAVAPVVKKVPPVASVAKVENEKSGGKQGAAVATAETTVRVDTHRLDEIMNMVGELVLVRNRFETLKASFNDEKMIKAVANLDVVTSDLQLAVMKTRMQPIKKVFGRFPRLVRDLARSLNKEVQLKLEGEDTDLDKNLVEALADPLIHLVRNAVDHGIEAPDVRMSEGKKSEGLVILKASQEGDHILLTIDDDGKGMDAEVLRAKAVEKGLMDTESAARLSQKECFNLIFMPGFSTKTEISDISGRGVGMDVVKTRITQMNGTVEIDSVKGRGSRIAINVPLTLAIMPTLMVKLQQQTFALPLTSVVEILDLDLKKINVVDGQTVVVVRNRALPLFYLKEWLIEGGMNDSHPNDKGHVVVVNAGGQHVGFVVDHLVGQEEVVIKALGAKLQGLPGLAGATITGDGMIALILDVPGLMKKYAA